MHHRMKVDAPSGTAVLLGEAAAEGRAVDLAKQRVADRDGITGRASPARSASRPCAAARSWATTR
jgi:4-hydroxy-tetrahydrodipicolinate reductase